LESPDVSSLCIRSTMNRTEKATLMMERFVHPNNGYSTQVHLAEDTPRRKAGTYFFRETQGWCSHEPKHTKIAECSDLTPAVFTVAQMVQHLRGEKTYAPFQLNGEGDVKWLCIDVDAYDDAPEEEVRDITTRIAKRVYRLLGPNSCLVEHSGSKGYHIWVFFDGCVQTYFAYALGHKLVRELPSTEQIAIEVYPKQQHTQHFGNTVKLPLGVHRKTGKRCWFVDSTFTPYGDPWSKLRDVRLVPVAWVMKNVEAFEPEPDMYTLEMRHTPLCLAEAMDNGVHEGIRDLAAFKIACYLRDKGIPERFAHDLMDRWNNENTPPLDAEQLNSKIEQGYGVKSYSWKPCILSEFDHLCKSSCPFWNRKVQRRWVNKDTSPIGVISRE
jgi:hypothetical protein